MVRRIGLLGAAVVLAMAGCHGAPSAAPGSASGGPSGGSGTPPAASPSGSATVPASPEASAAGTVAGTRCHTGDLAGHVEGHGEGAGQRYAALGLTNVTRSPCTVYGYPGLQLVDASGAPLRTMAQRDQTQPPTLLTVQPQQTVWTVLHWTVVPADDEAANFCAPNPKQLRVIPPDETTQLSMAFDYGPVCQHGTISVGPFRTQRPATD
jgi:uncharacterized protein DUF4232